MSWRLAFLSVFAIGCTEYDLTNGLDTNEADEEEPDDDADPDDDIPAGSGGVEGIVCSPDGDGGITHARVWVELDDGEIVETETDADGHFVLEGLPAGEYTVYVERGSFHTEFDVVVDEGEITVLSVEECSVVLDGDVEIAVVSGSWDSIQIVLGDLGLQYTLIGGTGAHTQLLRDPDAMAQYDIIFFNCGMGDGWDMYRGEIAQNVRDYVRNGGSIYTSDWAYFLAEVSYPDMIKYVGNDTQIGSARVGVTGYVNATVRDNAMIAALGTDQAQINYDLDSWAAPLTIGTGEVLLRGQFEYYDPNDIWSYTPISTDGPLAARQYDGDGQMLFTSFHNEQQTTLDMEVLLQEIIFSL